MPGFDASGPRGMGPGTGGGRGMCRGSGGMQSGWGRGAFCRGGSRRRRYAGWVPGGGMPAPVDDAAVLAQQAAWLRQQLAAVEQRISQVETETPHA